MWNSICSYEDFSDLMIHKVIYTRNSKQQIYELWTNHQMPIKIRLKFARLTLSKWLLQWLRLFLLKSSCSNNARPPKYLVSILSNQKTSSLLKYSLFSYPNSVPHTFHHWKFTKSPWNFLILHKYFRTYKIYSFWRNELLCTTHRWLWSQKEGLYGLKGKIGKLTSFGKQRKYV